MFRSTHTPELAPLRPLVKYPETTLLVWDYDGTLADYAPDPAQARPTEPTKAAVAAATGRYAASGLLTGRPEAEASELMPSIENVVGIYGAEVRTGTHYWRDERFFARASEVVALVERWRERIEDCGMPIQVQGATCLIHFSTITGKARTRALRVVRSMAVEARRLGLPTRWLSDCLDIRPGHIDKAIGMDRMLNAAGHDIRYALYMGDDPGSDLAAFDYLVKQTKPRRRHGAPRLDAVCRVAVVHPERPQNRRLWHAADLRVDGVAGARGLTAYLAAAPG